MTSTYGLTVHNEVTLVTRVEKTSIFFEPPHADRSFGEKELAEPSPGKYQSVLTVVAPA